MAGSLIKYTGGAGVQTLGPVGCERVYGADASWPLNSVTDFLAWESEGKVAMELELLLYCLSNPTADPVPDFCFYSLDRIAHGDQLHALLRGPVVSPMPDAFPYALPSNGIRLRFSARAFRLRMACGNTEGKRFAASVQPVVAGASSEPTPNHAYGKFDGSYFPIGAREWRLLCDDPTQSVTLHSLTTPEVVVSTQPAGLYADWTPIDARAWRWDQPGLAVTKLPITAVYR